MTDDTLNESSPGGATGAAKASERNSRAAGDTTSLNVAQNAREAKPAASTARGRQFPHHPRTVRVLQLPTGAWSVADSWGVAFAPMREYTEALRQAVRHCRQYDALPDDRDPNAPIIAKRLNAQLKAQETRRKRQEVSA